MSRLLLATMLSLAPAIADAADTVRLQACAFDLDTGHYLYSEAYDQTLVNGKLISSQVHYFMPDGAEFGHKTVDFTNDDFAPDYRLDLTREGYAEGITVKGDTITLMRQRPHGDAATETVGKEGLVAADAGLVNLLRANLDALARGDALSFRVLAASRLGSYKFRARRIPDTTVEGKPAKRVQVDMDSMLKLFAGPLLFTFGDDNRLLEFRGPTNVRDPATGRDYTVRLAFSWSASAQNCQALRGEDKSHP